MNFENAFKNGIDLFDISETQKKLIVFADEVPGIKIESKDVCSRYIQSKRHMLKDRELSDQRILIEQEKKQLNNDFLSMPTVETFFPKNIPLVIFLNKHVFPTDESPININLYSIISSSLISKLLKSYWDILIFN